MTSNTYWDWMIDHTYLLVPAQVCVGKFLATFKEYPPRQKAASFTIDEVLQMLQQPPPRQQLRQGLKQFFLAHSTPRGLKGPPALS